MEYAWEYFLLATAVYCLAHWSVLWLLHIFALFNGKCRLHRRRDVSGLFGEKQPLPGVSILKPICASNADDNLFSNLETFFTLDYPKFELLICVQDSEDKRVLMYVDSLRAKFPAVDCQVFEGGENVGMNPKINNMQPGYKAAKYDLILVSDSGILMREDSLSDMVTCMTDNVGLVHQMPYSCDRSGLSATLEKVYFGTYHARIYLAANLLGINVATGMSALMRKSVLDDAGGIKAFGCYLAEDYFFAKEFLKKGLKLDISSQPALQNPGNCTVGVFQSRLTRWAQLRIAMAPHLLFFEPLSECITMGTLAAWAVFYLFRWDPVYFLLTHILVWFLMDWSLLNVVQNGPLPFSKFEFLATWVYREVSAPYLFLVALFHPAIRWRAGEFRLKWGGVVEISERTQKPKKICV